MYGVGRHAGSLVKGCLTTSFIVSLHDIRTIRTHIQGNRIIRLIVNLMLNGATGFDIATGLQ